MIEKRPHTATGRPRGPVPRPLDERFWEKVDRRGPDECWEWQGYLNESGYGYLSISHAGRALAPRVSMLLTGNDPLGQLVCHTCDNPRCVNPGHLYLGSQKDNMRDRSERGPRKALCGRGHAFTPENTLWEGSSRKCRACRRITQARWEAARVRPIRNGPRALLGRADQ